MFDIYSVNWTIVLLNVNRITEWTNRSRHKNFDHTHFVVWTTNAFIRWLFLYCKDLTKSSSRRTKLKIKYRKLPSALREVFFRSEDNAYIKCFFFFFQMSKLLTVYCVRNVTILYSLKWLLYIFFTSLWKIVSR